MFCVLRRTTKNDIKLRQIIIETYHTEVHRRHGGHRRCLFANVQQNIGSITILSATRQEGNILVAR